MKIVTAMSLVASLAVSSAFALEGTLEVVQKAESSTATSDEGCFPGVFRDLVDAGLFSEKVASTILEGKHTYSGPMVIAAGGVVNAPQSMMHNGVLMGDNTQLSFVYADGKVAIIKHVPDLHNKSQEERDALSNKLKEEMGVLQKERDARLQEWNDFLRMRSTNSALFERIMKGDPEIISALNKLIENGNTQDVNPVSTEEVINKTDQ